MAIALVQAAVTSSTGVPTFGSATTAGNCVVVCIGLGYGTVNPTVTGVTLGGSAGNFAALVTSAIGTARGGTAIWADPNCAGGQTAVAVTISGGSFKLAVAYEVSGVAN